MGHIGTYGDPVYISELENDIGLTPDSGTVTDVVIHAGKFDHVDYPTTVPNFNVPTHTSHLENSEGWKNGTIRTVKRNNSIVATYEPPYSGSANIVVNTKLSEFTNDLHYTNNPGTITGIGWENARPTGTITVNSGRAVLKIANNIASYNNNGNGEPNSKYATKKYGSQFTHIEYDSTTIDGFSYSATSSTPTRTFRLLRYGKLRILYFTLVYSADQTDIKTNSTFTLGSFGATGQDKPSSIYNSIYFFPIGDGETVYSNNNVNHYYPVSVILESSSLKLAIGGEGNNDTPHPHRACTTTNFRAVWLVD